VDNCNLVKTLLET